MLYEFNGKYPELDPSVYVAPGAYLIGDVHLGKDVSVWFHAVMRGDNDTITIGEGSNVQEGTIIHVDEGYPVNIGKNVTVGHRCVIHGCTIEEGAMIGMGAVVLNGAHIKKGAVVAAGAVVGENKVVEENTLAAGVPAKPLKTIQPAMQERVLAGTNFYKENGKRFQEAGIESGKPVNS